GQRLADLAQTTCGLLLEALRQRLVVRTETTRRGQQHRLDRLTVLPHDVGHLLGHEQADSGVREESLTAGTRRTPAAASRAGDAALLDQVFGNDQPLAGRGLFWEGNLGEVLLSPGKKRARGVSRRS